MGKEEIIPRDIKVVIPSAGRYETITGHNVIKNAIICVPANEYDRYKLMCSNNEVVAHPDMVGLAPKRNWICEKFGDVFMIDDDCKGMTRLYVTDSKEVKVDPETAYELIQFAGNMCALTGNYLFGFARWNNPMRCGGHEPILLKGTVFGQAFGLLKGSGMKFNENIKCNNDIYISLMNAYYHRTMWIDERFSFVYDSFGATKGGNSQFITQEVEWNDYATLKKLFGDAVTLKKPTWASKPKRPFEKQINLPY